MGGVKERSRSLQEPIGVERLCGAINELRFPSRLSKPSYEVGFGSAVVSEYLSVKGETICLCTVG